MKGLLVQQALWYADRVGVKRPEGQQSYTILLLVIARMLSNTILVPEDHSTAFDVTVVMVLVQELTAWMARIICSISGK